jgi:solute:Na+ symporter, SSS family
VRGERLYCGEGDLITSAAATLDLNANLLDYALIFFYFVVVIGIGFIARRSVKSGLDFFLSGRSLPAWITGLAFISANLGAIEILGMAANGAQYGVSTVHFYWVGAVPAMVFLGIVMMPFYYGAKVRSVPEYLRLRFNKPTHFFNAFTFALGTILIAGVNLYALSIVISALLGWPLFFAILLAAGIVLVYITLGGLSSAIYNEVLQFFIVMAGLLPLTILGLNDVGGWSGLVAKAEKTALGPLATNAWQGTGLDPTNPLGASWISIVFGLGFVLSFGYWTTNFAEVQRALSAKDLLAARRTPLIGAYPKIFIPAVTIIPGIVAVITVKNFGSGGDLDYNNAIPWLMQMYLPNGVLGIAITGLLAAFMAGLAANVTAFNTVVTYDLWQPYVQKDKSDAYYLRFGRIATVAGILISISTAFIAASYTNIMNYIQLLFSFFNAPLFATFIIAMFWKRATPWSGFFGLIAGTVGAATTYYLYLNDVIAFQSDLDEAFWGAIVAFVADAIVMVIVSLVTQPKPLEELDGLVWGMAKVDESDKGKPVWWKSPALMGSVALILVLILNFMFI